MLQLSAELSWGRQPRSTRKSPYFALPNSFRSGDVAGNPARLIQREHVSDIGIGAGLAPIDVSEGLAARVLYLVASGYLFDCPGWREAAISSHHSLLHSGVEPVAVTGIDCVGGAAQISRNFGRARERQCSMIPASM